MHWKQVRLVAQAFTASKPLAIWTKCEPVFSIYVPAEEGAKDGLDLHASTQHLLPRLQVMPRFVDFGVEGAWTVRRGGLRPIYSPAVNTMEALRDALERAWGPPNLCKGIRRTVEEDRGWDRPLLLAAK